MRKQTHTYSTQMQGQEYVLDAADSNGEGSELYMTGWRRGIRPSDEIVLQEGTTSQRYQVKAIDYYCDTPDMWTAVLVKRS